MEQSDIEKFERDMEARRKMPEYELTIVTRLPDEAALQSLMMKIAEHLYAADPMAAFGGVGKQVRKSVHQPTGPVRVYTKDSRGRAISDDELKGLADSASDEQR